MNIFSIVVLACLGAHPQSQEFDMNKLNRLVELRQSAEALQKLETHGYLPLNNPAREQIFKSIYAEAETIVGEHVTYDKLVQLTGRAKSPMEKLAGFFTFVNILYITGGILMVSAIVWLFGIYILTLTMLIPKSVWEIGLYGLSIFLMISGSRVSPDWYLAPVLLGCFGLVGCFQFTRFRHFGLKWYERAELDSLLHQTEAWACTFIWGFVALYYGSHIIGFMAIMAFMTALNFVAGTVPGVVYLGWDKDEQVPRTTVAAGLLLILYVLMSITGTNPRIAVFQEGLAFWGTLVYFLGVLIMSSKWYAEDAKYWSMQLLCIASGVLALWLGSVYGLGMLTGIGGTLFYLYLIEKYYELPWEGAGWAWSLLGLSGILYGFAIFAQAHPQYFLFMHR